jgi:NTE family protein
MEGTKQRESSQLTDKEIPNKQIALVLQGGGALGAYEVGVIKKLHEVLTKKFKENRLKDVHSSSKERPLFDIIAGTSIGAINAAVLISNVVKKNKSWKDAINQLENFWMQGLASNPKVYYPPEGVEQVNAEALPWWQPWKDKWQQKKNIGGIASEESARRYYSTKLFWTFGAEHIYRLPIVRYDHKFFDADNKWYNYDNMPLQSTIQSFADFPISTSFKEDQPRLLITSVDIAEGKAITFDSYEKAAGIRKTEYYVENNNISGEKGSKKNKTRRTVRGTDKLMTLRYDKGIELEHVMASGTLPGFYDPKEIGKRKFWDGGILSNTPFRELLWAHHDYWINVEGREKAPDLDVYIVNVHTPKIPLKMIPKYYDEVEDRNNDILFGDRSSIYDQYTATLIADYIAFIDNLKKLAITCIKNDKERNIFEKELTKLETKEAKSGSVINTHKHTKYRDLLRGRYELTKVKRIERKYRPDDNSHKTGDFTLKTISTLIKEGEYDVNELLG